jgi:DNA-binding CsgD family transcriptional regulator
VAQVPTGDPASDLDRRPDLSIPGARTSRVGAPFAPDDFRLDVIAALRDMLDRVEDGSLEPTPVSGAGLAVVVEYDNVRCLVVDVRCENHGLSPREFEIARLVAHGATNRAIATTLDISLWTVSTHLRRIFAKLAVSSRAEMVANLFGTPHVPS